MRQAYPVIFTQIDDKKNTVLIEVPDLELMTEGFGTADAMLMARDAIGVNIITRQDKDEDIPDPSDISQINVEKGIFAGEGKSYISLVDLDIDEYRRREDNRTVRRNVTLPNWLNQKAEKAHINVSGVLQEALKQKLSC